MMKKKQVVRRMGGGPMKKQVVKKRGGGSMKPMAMNIGGSMSPGEKKARSGAGPTFIARRKSLAPAVGAATGKGLTSSTLMKAFKKAKKIKPSGRLNLDDIKRALK